jgi:hypothetical protein
MPISFHAGEDLPHTVAAVLAQHSDRTVVVLNYALVELMSPLELMDMLNALFAKMGRPPTGRQLDELAAPRRQRSRRAQEDHWRTELSTPKRTELRGLHYDGERERDVSGE